MSRKNSKSVRNNGELTKEAEATPLSLRVVFERMLENQLKNLNNEVANGHATVQENEKKIEDLKAQVYRLEGAKYLAQQLLAELQTAEK